MAQQLLNADLRTMRTALFSGLSKPTFQPFTMAQNVLAALDAIGGDTQRQRVHAQWVVRFVIDFYEDALRQWCGVPSDGRKSDEAAAFLQRFAAQEPDMAELIGRAIDRCRRCGRATRRQCRDSAVPRGPLQRPRHAVRRTERQQLGQRPITSSDVTPARNRTLHFPETRASLAERPPQTRPAAQDDANGKARRMHRIGDGDSGMIWNRHITNQPTIQMTVLGVT